MTACQLVDAQEHIDAYLAFLPTNSRGTIKLQSADIQFRAGSLRLSELAPHIRDTVPEIFASAELLLINERVRDLFEGDISGNNNDHSSADLALTRLLAGRGLGHDDIDQVFRASKLYRPKWDEMRGHNTYGQITIAKALEGQSTEGPTRSPEVISRQPSINFLPDQHKPVFISGGMPKREFVGPTIQGNLTLYPLCALSAVVALGAVGKTSLLISHACHVAAGKPWHSFQLSQAKVIYFSVEETQDELNRKFSATTLNWPQNQQQKAIDNLLLVSLLGKDMRLVTNERGTYKGSGAAEKIIALAQTFGLTAGLIILDHMQGLATGDMNSSETATAICREANKIVAATGAAVVFAAHISKANINATAIGQGLAVGSLAFENALRQLGGMIHMQPDEAIKYGLEGMHKDYVRLEVPKNSYGPSEGGVWLKKVYVPSYHTIVMEPVVLTLPVKGPMKSTHERVQAAIVEHVKKDLWTTRNKLDLLAGLDGQFKVSKAVLREVLAASLGCGLLVMHPISAQDRTNNELNKQVTEVLRANS